MTSIVSIPMNNRLSPVRATGFPDHWSGSNGSYALAYPDGVLVLDPEVSYWIALEQVEGLTRIGQHWVFATWSEVDSEVALYGFSDGRLTELGRLDGVTHLITMRRETLVVFRLHQCMAYRTTMDGVHRVPLPLGAARGRLAASGEWMVWADGCTLYRRAPSGVTRCLGSVEDRVSHLAVADSGIVVCGLGGTRVRIFDTAGGEQTIDQLEVVGVTSNPHGVAVRDGDDVVLVNGTDATLRRLRGCWPAGTMAAAIYPETGTVVGFDGTEVFENVFPAATAIHHGSILGPGGRRWDVETGEAGPFESQLLAEHLCAGKDLTLAVLDGTYSIHHSATGWTDYRPLPSPFDDPDELADVQVVADGIWLIGYDASALMSWSGQLLEGSADPPDRSRPELPGWHWNDSGLLLRIATGD